tara:strand:- start:390 stop:581 length:192 start_codon:yes stop_codon:yes gene_type:complete
VVETVEAAVVAATAEAEGAAAEAPQEAGKETETVESEAEPGGRASAPEATKGKEATVATAMRR